MLVKIGKNTLKLVSAHHAEINYTIQLLKTKEDPVMQTFVLSNDEVILGLHLLERSSNSAGDSEHEDTKDENNESTSNSTTNSSGKRFFFYSFYNYFFSNNQDSNLLVKYMPKFQMECYLLIWFSWNFFHI